MRVGIERLNAYVGAAAIDVSEIFKARGLSMQRFDNLMMREKSVGLPCEDAVTLAVNAAKPIVDRLRAEERARIEMVVTASESGIDFGKSISTYLHEHLDLGRRCKVFEVKQACFGGTAGLGIAASHVVAHGDPGAKVLVVATDVARPPSAAEGSYVEPSQGAGAVAFLVGGSPDVLELDFGATGSHSYQVMDTCRPGVDVETGDPDLSLLSYLDCLDQCFKAYAEKVDGVDLMSTFDHLAFHTPFGGMVKGAHRRILRKVAAASGDVVEADFARRVLPSLEYGMRVGNLYSASLYLALASLVDHVAFPAAQRVGLYSYGSGCSSEFFSGVVGPRSHEALSEMDLRGVVDGRCRLTWSEYEAIVEESRRLCFGVKDVEVDVSSCARAFDHALAGRGRLVLRGIRDYHREYAWT